MIILLFYICVYVLISDVKKVHYKSETQRYSEIFRDFDNLELSLLYS